MCAVLQESCAGIVEERAQIIHPAFWLAQLGLVMLVCMVLCLADTPQRIWALPTRVLLSCAVLCQGPSHPTFIMGLIYHTATIPTVQPGLPHCTATSVTLLPCLMQAFAAAKASCKQEPALQLTAAKQHYCTCRTSRRLLSEVWEHWKLRLEVSMRRQQWGLAAPPAQRSTRPAADSSLQVATLNDQSLFYSDSDHAATK